jgi:hypothetical protein
VLTVLKSGNLLGPSGPVQTSNRTVLCINLFDNLWVLSLCHYVSAYVYDVNTTPETVTLKFGDCGGYGAMLNNYFSASRVVRILLQHHQPADIFGSTCQLRDILRL